MHRVKSVSCVLLAILAGSCIAACSPYYGGYGPEPQSQPEPPAPQVVAPAPPLASAPAGNRVIPNLICSPDQKIALSNVVVQGIVLAKSDCVVTLSNCEIRGGILATKDAKVRLSRCVVHGSVRATNDARVEADSSTRFTGQLSASDGGRILR